MATKDLDFDFGGQEIIIKNVLLEQNSFTERVSRKQCDPLLFFKLATLIENQLINAHSSPDILTVKHQFSLMRHFPRFMKWSVDQNGIL